MLNVVNVKYLGPVATALSNRFGVKTVTFIGGLLVGLGVAISAFAPNTEFLFFSYSFCTGIYYLSHS